MVTKVEVNISVHTFDAKSGVVVGTRTAAYVVANDDEVVALDGARSIVDDFFVNIGNIPKGVELPPAPSQPDLTAGLGVIPRNSGGGRTRH